MVVLSLVDTSQTKVPGVELTLGAAAGKLPVAPATPRGTPPRPTQAPHWQRPPFKDVAEETTPAGCCQPSRRLRLTGFCRSHPRRRGGGPLPASASDSCPDGVMHVEPGQPAGNSQDPEHGSPRPGQRKPVTLSTGLLAVPGEHGEARTIDENHAGEVNDATCPLPPPDISQMRPQRRGAQEIQLTAQARHNHIPVITDARLRERRSISSRHTRNDNRCRRLGSTDR